MICSVKERAAKEHRHVGKIFLICAYFQRIYFGVVLGELGVQWPGRLAAGLGQLQWFVLAPW